MKKQVFRGQDAKELTAARLLGVFGNLFGVRFKTSKRTGAVLVICRDKKATDEFSRLFETAKDSNHVQLVAGV